jgi:acylpyruvate hydrolase
MRVATIRTPHGTRAVRVDKAQAVETGHADVGALLANDDWERLSEVDSGPRHDPVDLEYAPLVPSPSKVICVGLNYRNHILEMGRELPEHPTLFAKFAEALIGATDDIVLAPESSAVDWEAELAIVIGRTVRRADATRATAAIAGFTVVNDVTMRDWQYRTTQWMQGKTFEATTPLGPHLVTPDELAGGVRRRWRSQPRSTVRWCRRPTRQSWCSTPSRSSNTSRQSSPSAQATSSPREHRAVSGTPEHPSAT